MSMKSVWAWVAIVVLAGTLPATANVYQQTINHSQILLDPLFLPGIPYAFYHANPAEIPLGPLTPEGYADAVQLGRITDVTLAFNVRCLDPDEQVRVWLDPVGPQQGWTMIGMISGNGETVFDLDDPDVFGPGGGLDGLPVAIRLEGVQSWCNWLDVAKLESSTLSVAVADGYAPPTVPVPAAAVIGLIGLACVGLYVRRAGRAAHA